MIAELFKETPPSPEALEELKRVNAIDECVARGDVAEFAKLVDRKEVAGAGLDGYLLRAVAAGHTDLMLHCLEGRSLCEATVVAAVDTAIGRERTAVLRELLRRFHLRHCAGRFQYRFIGALMRSNLVIAEMLQKVFGYGTSVLNWGAAAAAACGKKDSVVWLFAVGADDIRRAAGEAEWMGHGTLARQILVANNPS
ncbi:MAG: hypothetical protein KGL39_01530 [Patescibacteria group bacterium]|nr:hypothetical protein [Patescibacteria group bacterium]